MSDSTTAAPKATASVNWLSGFDYGEFGANDNSIASTAPVSVPAAAVTNKRPRAYSPPPPPPPPSRSASETAARRPIDDYERLEDSLHKMAKLMSELGDTMHEVKREISQIKRRT